jgi:membrane fusion protein (multidrug efflux system)
MYAAIGVFSLASQSFAQQIFAQQAIPVGVVTAERKPVATTADFVWRVNAVDRVEVRARVTGYLQQVLFKEGDTVKEGAPLYTIEKDLFDAAVKQAEGALERSKAVKILTDMQLQRAEELLAKAAGTAVARDQAQAADQQAQGMFLIDEANLNTARINLGYTDITSQITGKVGKTSLTKGNVVSPGSGPLTVIVSQNPMYVDFPISQREFQKARAEQNVNVRDLKIRLRFADDTIYDQVGIINFVDVTVDRATDTVLIRATFPNPKPTLVDGQLVRVTLESSKPDDKVVVPQGALIADQEGVYVFIVENGKASIRRIKPGSESGTNIVVEQGLSGGELVIIDGLQGVRPGATVRATPVQPVTSRS